MTKLIPSISYELGLARDKIQELTERNKQLEGEISRLKSCLEKNNIPLRTDKHSQPSIQQATVEKHYLASTKASRNRHIQSLSQATENLNQQGFITIKSKRYRYQDGILIDNNPDYYGWGGVHRYLWPTRSSFEKQRPRLRYLREDDYDSDTGYETSATPDSFITDVWEGEIREELADEPVEEPAKKSIRELISEKSELERDVESHLSSVPVRSDIVYNLLSRSLRLAQEVFYDGSRKYIPEAHEEYDGPHEVRFGWKEMQESFFRKMYTDKIIAGKRYQIGELEAYMDLITYIRNQVCHFKNCGYICKVNKLDHAIRDVQKLAAIFGDEARALQARALRDELNEEAERGLIELETMWLLAELPGARPWQRYQCFSFWTVLHSHGEGELVTRVAQGWEQQHPPRDSLSWPPRYIREYRDLLDSWTEQL